MNDQLNSRIDNFIILVILILGAVTIWSVLLGLDDSFALVFVMFIYVFVCVIQMCRLLWKECIILLSLPYLYYYYLQSNLSYTLLRKSSH